MANSAGVKGGGGNHLLEGSTEVGVGGRQIEAFFHTLVTMSA